MASSSNRRLSSSGSSRRRKPSQRSYRRGRDTAVSSRSSSRNTRSSYDGARSRDQKRPLRSSRNSGQRSQRHHSRAADGYSYGSLRRDKAKERQRNIRRERRRSLFPWFIIIVLLIAAAIAWFSIYNSSLFSIENVTSDELNNISLEEISDIAAVPSGSTLLRVDTEAIEQRLLEHPWIMEATVEKKFPDTLHLSLIERTPIALVMINQLGESWYVSSDSHWIVNIDAVGMNQVAEEIDGSLEETQPVEDAQTEEDGDKTPEDETPTTSTIIDAVRAYGQQHGLIVVTGVKEGLQPKIGGAVEDPGVLSVISYIEGLSPAMLDRLISFQAPSAESVSASLTNGVEVSLGAPQEIELKEQMILRLLAEHQDGITYINVRVPSKPAWRGLPQ